VSADILGRFPHPDDGRRRVYLPTENGIALLPVLLELVVWGEAHTAAPSQAEIVDAIRVDRGAVIDGLAKKARGNRDRLTVWSRRRRVQPKRRGTSRVPKVSSWQSLLFPRKTVRRLSLRIRPRLAAFGSAAAVVFFSACATTAPSADSNTDAAPTEVSRDDEPIDTDLALVTFDSAWSRINASYYDPDFRGIDWVGVRDELRPEAEAVETRGDLRAILRDMLSRLGESHFAILPQEGVDGIDVGDDGLATDTEAGDVGLELRWVEGDLTVFRAEAGPAVDAGVGPGWVVEAIDEVEMERWREVMAIAETDAARDRLELETVSGAHSLLQGPVGSSLTLRVLDGRDELHTFTLERQRVRGQMVRFGQLPALAAHLDFERQSVGDSCVGVIAFNIWMVPLVADFNRAVDALADCRGMVLDLRGNLGGVGGMVMSTAGSFYSQRAELGVVQSRAGEMRFVAMPRGVDSDGQLREAFTGPLAVLIDGRSVSTSEIFAAGLKSTGRARLFGTNTPGQALPAMTLRLPNEDVLYHVVSNLTDPEGQRIEGEGVVPDERVVLRRAELLAGRDAALEAAVAWAATAPEPAPAW